MNHPAVVTETLYKMLSSALNPAQITIANMLGEVKQFWLSSKGIFFASIDSVDANYFWSVQENTWLSVGPEFHHSNNKFAHEQDAPVPLEEIDFDNEEQVEKLKRQKVEVEVGLLAYLLGYYYTGGGEPDSLNARLDDSMQAVKD